MTSMVIDAGGRAVRLSNLDKVLWPATGFTKGQMIDFYRRLAPVLLRHLSGRPLTLARFPDGVDGRGWYQTDCRNTPPWMETLPVPNPSGGPGGRNYCLVDDVAGLTWVANLAAIELHPLLSCRDDLSTPTMVMFDLDPGPPAGVLHCAAVALQLRDVLDRLGLAAFPKTSGSWGMHVCVPLNSPAAFAKSKAFARAVARLLAARHPDRVIDRSVRAARAGRVFIDWGQNDPSKSTAAVYSLRAQPHPLVSTPLSWDEVDRAVAGGHERLLLFDARRVLERVDRAGDVFRPVLDVVQALPEGEPDEIAPAPPR